MGTGLRDDNPRSLPESVLRKEDFSRRLDEVGEVALLGGKKDAEGGEHRPGRHLGPDDGEHL